jgi:hypothetical protein
MGDIGPKTEYPAMEEREKSIRAPYVALAGGRRGGRCRAPAPLEG